MKISTLTTDLLVNKDPFHWPILYRYIIPFSFKTYHKSVPFLHWSTKTNSLHLFTSPKCDYFILYNKKYLTYGHTNLVLVNYLSSTNLAILQHQCPVSFQELWLLMRVYTAITVFSKIVWYCYPKCADRYNVWKGYTGPFPEEFCL